MEWKLPSTPTLAPYTTKKIQKAAQAESAAAASSPSDADADADGESIPSEEGQLFRAAEEASVREMVVSTAQHSRAAQPGRGGGQQTTTYTDCHIIRANRRLSSPSLTADNFFSLSFFSKSTRAPPPIQKNQTHHRWTRTGPAPPP